MLDRLFGFDHHRHHTPWDDAPPWAIEIGMMLALIIRQGESTMSIVDDIKTAQAATDQKISDLSTDVQALVAKLGSVPTGDLPPDVAAALQDIKDHADRINDALGAIDTAAKGTTAPATPPAA